MSNEVFELLQSGGIILTAIAVIMDWSDLEPVKLPVTLNFGYVSDDGSSTDGRYRDAIIKELARLHRIAPVGKLPTNDARIDELLTILEDVEGDE